MCRAGAIDPTDAIVSHKALPTLVRMCKQDRTWEERVEGLSGSVVFKKEKEINL